MEESEEKLQKLYMEFQMLDQQIKRLEKQNESLSSHLMELMATSQSLEDMGKVSNGAEILVPLSSGIYAKAELKDNNNFIVNVGANIALSKDVQSTKKIIENQISEIKKLKESLMLQTHSQMQKAASLEQEMEKIASTLQGNNQ